MLEILEDLGQGQREGEGGERQVEAFESEGGPAEEKAHHEAEDAGRRNGPAVANAPPVDHDRRGISADRVEGAVAEGDLAVVARQDVEAEQRDRVDAVLGELE